jgi:beta-lactamase class A
MYFRDLKNGPTFGVNFLVDFAPASLIKLPVAFVFLAAAEFDPGILQLRRAFIGTTESLLQDIEPGKTAIPNQPYTVNDLLKMTISYSDNASYFVLDEFLNETPAGTNARLQTFKELGVIDPKDYEDATLSVRGYSSLFTTLYNSTFLTKEYSQLLLRWLAESDYNNGLRAGIPAKIPIAHKFGIRTESPTVRQLHDCGIVYFPGNPYTLCVMTRGSEVQNLERAIASIAKIVHEEVTSRRIDVLPAR